MKTLYKKVEINKIIDVLLALLLNLIIFSTNNKLMMYTKHISVFFVLICLLEVCLLKKDLVIKINKFKILYLLFLIFICFSLVYVDEVKPILEYSIYFVLGLCIVLSDFQNAFYYYFLRIFKFLFWIFIFSMFLEALLPNAFDILFSFASFGDVEMRAITSGGAIAGLAFEKAYAAFLCNLGLGIIFSEFVLTKSFKNVIQIIIVMIALMMTGKRTLFIIPIIILLIYTILFSENNKIIKLAAVGLTISLLVLLIYTFVPGASLIINRLLESNGDILSGRENFWNYAMEMFHEAPICGTGFLSFNEYVYNQGFRYYGGKWNYQAHNVYFQLLGETGIVGFALVVTLIILLLVTAIVVAKKEKQFWNILLVYWIILFAIYGITGNTIYYPCQLLILFLCIIFISDKKKIKNIRYRSSKTFKFRF